MNTLKRYPYFFAILITLPCFSKAQKDTSSPIRQVEIVNFKPGSTPGDERMMDSSMWKVAKHMPLVKAFEWGTGSGNSNKNKVTHVYVTTFNSQGDMVTYNATPAHQALVSTKGTPVESVTTVSYPVKQ